jgi:hypothetical protein
MSDDEAPKSALELAMERLRRKDREAGVEEKPLTDAQKKAIAEARSVHDARAAEREILHQSQLARTADPAAREALEEEYRRDRERLASDRDEKLAKIRKG